VTSLWAASGSGYYEVDTAGDVAAFAGPRCFGAMSGTPLNEPIVGMATVASGLGYWLVARDGGIFAFGDARFHGSSGGIHLNQPSWAWPPPPPVRATGWWPPTGGFSPSAMPSSTAPLGSYGSTSRRWACLDGFGTGLASIIRPTSG